MMMSRIVPLACVLIAIGIFFGYINPQYTDTVATLSKKIQSYDGALAAAKQFSKKESELATARAAISDASISRLEAYLPDGVDNVQLILDLNGLAARSGLALSNFNVQSPSTTAVNSASANTGTSPGTFTAANAESGQAIPLGSNSPVDSLTVSVSATGSYSALRTFLTGVEQSLRPLDLIDLNVTVSPTKVYSYDMTFRIYWLH